MFDMTDLELRCRERTEMAARINTHGHLKVTKSSPARVMRAVLATQLIRLGLWLAPVPPVDSLLDSTPVGEARL